MSFHGLCLTVTWRKPCRNNQVMGKGIIATCDINNWQQITLSRKNERFTSATSQFVRHYTCHMYPQSEKFMGFSPNNSKYECSKLCNHNNKGNLSNHRNTGTLDNHVTIITTNTTITLETKLIIQVFVGLHLQCTLFLSSFVKFGMCQQMLGVLSTNCHAMPSCPIRKKTDWHKVGIRNCFAKFLKQIWQKTSTSVHPTFCLLYEMVIARTGRS